MNILRVPLWPLRNRRESRLATGQTLPAATGSDSATASVPYKDLEVVYATPNYATRWRVDTFFAKEPDTLEWIAGFQADEIMVDVDANVGMYSIWAAMTRNVRVIAFEPESQNYALLYRNIVLDGVEHKVLAGCRNVLAGPAVKSVLVEINTNLEEHRSLIALLESAGFAYSPDQVNRYIRKEGGFKGVGNYVFYR